MNSDEEEAAIRFLEARAGKRRQFTKICTQCKARKPTSEFYLSKGTGRRKSECTECSRANQKNYNKKGSPRTLFKARVRHYMKSYGMGLPEALELTVNRTGLCEICRKVSKLVIDHSHESDSVRGKICHTCNVMLGGAKDDPDILFSAIEYLERYKELLTQSTKAGMILDEDQS